jgi:hypothetical protein
MGERIFGEVMTTWEDMLLASAPAGRAAFDSLGKLSMQRRAQSNGVHRALRLITVSAGCG